jgi:Uma2 family endonuclease
MLAQTTHRFSVTNYHRMAEIGVLSPEARVELIEGEIIDMSPIGQFHRGIVARMAHLFMKLSSDRWLVWPQNSIRLDEYSEPEPDIALL